MNSNNITYRYPGTRPFTKFDENLFFGRDEDIENLSQFIVLEKQVVLYGKSGLGKTSLLNAGVLPKLERNQNTVINVRFGSHTVDKVYYTPTDILRQQIAKDITYDNFLWSKVLQFSPKTIQNPTNEQLNILENLWYYCKTLDISQTKNDTILIVFDQFEELFTYQEEEVKQLKESLSELLNIKVPQHIRDLMKEKGKDFLSPTEKQMLYKPLNIKVVFSIRSDKMSSLNRLKTHFPQILQKTYELKPLSNSQAKHAMLEPAKVEGDFESVKFEYNKQAIDKIIHKLTGSGKQDIETTQLQIVCHRIEENIVAKTDALGDLSKQPPPDPIILTVNDIPEFKYIFKEYYHSSIDKLPEDKQQGARIFIEDELIRNEQRISLDEGHCRGKISKDTLNKLVKSHLLRCELNSLGNNSYELSHDTLVEPILEDKEERKIKEREEDALRIKNEELHNAKVQAEKAHTQHELEQKRKMIMIVGSVAMVAIIALVFAIDLYFKADKSQAMAEEQGKIAIEANENSKKIIDALYFYKNKFALANNKKGLFGFINKQGDALIAYKYDEALPFDSYTGLSKVNRIGEDYFINTTGREYLLASDNGKLTGLTQALDLSNKNLTQIPIEVFNYPQLRILLLNDNMLKDLPPEIGSLTNLVKLYLSKNQLTGLTPEIGRLTNLNALHLSRNELADLPPEIWNFTNLSELHLNNNQLTGLPPEIRNLINLSELHLNNNQLTGLPPEIGNLTNISELHLNNNQLTSLPPEIRNLINLSELHLNNNQLTVLPPEIGKFTNLSELDLEENQLTALPTEIGKLTNLRALEVGINHLTELPSEIMNLTNLSYLYLSVNNLRNLPLEIGKLTKLTLLFLSQNELTSLPPEIGKLINLEELWLLDNQLAALPTEIGNLKNLRYLCLSENKFSADEKEKIKRLLPNCEITF